LDWTYGLLLGIVQGVTEFLPVSSSGHLALMEHVFGIHTQVPEFFDVLLHLGTLAAVFIVFRRDIAEMFRALPDLFKKTDPSAPGGKRLILLIIIGTLPLALAIPFTGAVEELKDNVYFIGSALIMTAVLLFLASRHRDGAKEERSAKYTDALAVGLAQAMAVVPGLSRSGTTLTVGLFSGFSRPFAIRYAFLLSIPAIVGANIVKFFYALRDGIDPAILPACIIGVLAAAVVGVLSINLLKKLARKLHIFAAYCLAAGTVAIVSQIIMR